jgi:HK97 family phage portal protein
MILKTPGGNREMFGAFDSSVPVPRPSQVGGAQSYAGQRVTLQGAVGLPAFMLGIRLLSETPAKMPIKLFRGAQPQAPQLGKTPEPGAPQLTLLRRPNPDMTAFQAWSYTIASMLRGNALIWKVKTRRGVEGLYPINPALVNIKRKDGQMVYEIRSRPLGAVVARVGTDQVIHIPGILVEDPLIGVSIIEAFAHNLGSQLGMQEFQGRFLANDGSPGVVLKTDGSPTKAQRDEIRDSYEARHQGTANTGRPGLLWGGWSIDRVAVSMQDAQFIEAQRFSVDDVGRILGIPATLLNQLDQPNRQTTEQEYRRFLNAGLSFWITRLEQGLAADPDLFLEPDWEVQFDYSDVLKADIQVRYDAYRLARQGGWITANEIRAEEGRAPIDGGDELQQTPVGGAPNPGSASSDATPA